MALVTKIDSNITGLRYAEELTLGVLPGSPVWVQLEPNSYTDFGGEFTSVNRNPINEGRQNQKGVTVDLDASGGFNTDITQGVNLQDLMQGFFFADLRRKGEELVTNVDGTTEDYDVAATAGFLVGSIVLATGFSTAANNGVKTVDAIVVDTSIGVDQDLVDEPAPPATAGLVVVGHTGAAGDFDIDASGSLPALTTVAEDFTTFGFIPGEWMFIGGDGAALGFAGSENNGFARIASIATLRIEFDKTVDTMTTEASTTETVEIYFMRVLKNESVLATQVRRSYNIERTLGAPDDASPAQIQSEYLVGAVANEITITAGTADKMVMDMAFVAIDNEQRTGVTGVKSGTRPALAAQDAFNTSNDFSRIKMVILDPVDSNPTALFGFLTDFTVTINNNLVINKAIGTLGGFEITAGQFTVGGTVGAYFSSTPAVAAVRNNSDVSIDFAMVKLQTVSGLSINQGVLVDMCLVALGDGRLNVEQDSPVTLPLDMAAGADRNFNHTLLMGWFDFLPAAANT